jgi:hypothetical protein
VQEQAPDHLRAQAPIRRRLGDVDRLAGDRGADDAALDIAQAQIAAQGVTIRILARHAAALRGQARKISRRRQAPDCRVPGFALAWVWGTPKAWRARAAQRPSQITHDDLCSVRSLGSRRVFQRTTAPGGAKVSPHPFDQSVWHEAVAMTTTQGPVFRPLSSPASCWRRHR